MRATVIAGFLAGLLASELRAQGAGPPSLSAARVTGQVAVGAVLTPVAFLGAGWTADRLAGKAGWNDESASRAAYIAAYTGAWIAAATGPALVGQDGRYAAALGGSLAGFGAAWLSHRFGNWVWDEDKRPCRLGCWMVGALTVALPSIGATVAYNESRK